MTPGAKVITFESPREVEEVAKPAPAPAPREPKPAKAEASKPAKAEASKPAKAEPPRSGGVLAALRVRGHRKVRTTTEDAMRSLGLTRANHLVLLPAAPDYVGQLQKAKDYVTWGPVGAKEVAELIRSRGRLEGDRPITDADVQSGSKYKTIDEFAQAVARGEARYRDLAHVKPLFRLHPPKKGFRGGTKRSVGAHGNLGNRGARMGELIQRMM